MSTQYANADGSVTPKMIRYYEERAKGGTGLVIVEFAYVDDKGSRTEWAQLAGYSDTQLPGLAELAERIRVHGATSCLQIAHAGSQKLHNNPPFVAPSAIPWTEKSPVPKELTIEEIDEILNAFASSTVRAKRAGFEMVELHGAHGYLITQFLSETYNKRTDKYGGSLENRQRFVVELVERCKKAAGKDYPIGIRLSAEDYSGGFNIEDTIVLVKKLEALGIDYIHVSSGTYASRERRITPTYFYPLGNFIPLAHAIKQETKVPVIASGSILDPDMASDCIASGQADMVAMARQLFADPAWANKVQKNDLDEVVRCIRCNEGCLLKIMEGKAVRCWVNPAAGNEAEFELRPPLRKRRVMVIGGGPAGLEAARTAAARGHEVVLFDENERLGGQLIPAAAPRFKQDLVPLNEYLVRQVYKNKVDVHSGSRATAKDIAAFDPEVVFLATGAKPVWPNVRMSKHTPQMVSAFDVVTGKVQVGKRVIVVGGGLIGAETAWMLAEQGKQVTVTTRRDIIGQDLMYISRVVLYDGYKKHGVVSVTNSNLDEITEKGAVFIDRNWERHQYEADTLVLASGMTPQLSLAEDPVMAGRELLILGDARKPRNIGDAIFDGAYLARQI